MAKQSVLTHGQTQGLSSSKTEAEYAEEREREEKELKQFFADAKAADRKLAELRDPVNKAVKEIEQLYAAMEKKGYDRKVLKVLYKNRSTFTPEFRFTANVYLKRIGEPLPLFSDLDTVKH